MSEYNLVRLQGKLSFDPQLKEFSTGNTLGVLNLACKAERGMLFIDVNVWNKELQKIVNTLNKGDEVQVVGELRSHSWVSKGGEKHKSIAVVAEDLRPTAKELQKEIGDVETFNQDTERDG